jgi:hypothetical protein
VKKAEISKMKKRNDIKGLNFINSCKLKCFAGKNCF